MADIGNQILELRRLLEHHIKPLVSALQNMAPTCGLITSVGDGYINFSCALVRGHKGICQSHEKQHKRLVDNDQSGRGAYRRDGASNL